MRRYLVEERKKAGLTQAVVATRLGRPQSYVADIERNERRVDVIEFLALADAIGFDPFNGLREVAAAEA